MRAILVSLILFNIFLMPSIAISIAPSSIPPAGMAQVVPPDRRLDYLRLFYSQRAYPSPSIPANAYAKAAQTKIRYLAGFQTIGGAWSSIGPSPITGCSVTGNYCSGRVSAIALDPTHSNTIYVGGAQGGVWKSTNNGATWTALTDSQPSLAVGSIAVDPSGNVYVGTGEGNLSCDSYYGAGVLKSTDGGSTWVQLGASTFGSLSISKIIVNPNTPSIVIASALFGATTSSTEACVPVSGGTPGVYVSTDGGSTWTRTLTGTAYDVAMDPTNPSTVYAAVAGSMYKSTNSGSTWAGPLGGGFPTSGVGRVAIGISASAPGTLFAAMNLNGAGALYKSTNGGTNWSSLTVPSGPFKDGYCSSQCWYDIYIAVDPTNVNTLYLGGLDLYRSTNGGTTWTDDLGGYTGNIHPDQHAFAFSPSSHSTIYAGNDGGVWYSSTGDTCTPSSCWTNVNNGLTITQFQALAAHPTDGKTYFGGTQDNGSPEFTGSAIWAMLIGGDGGWTAFDRTSPTTMYHTFYYVSPQRSDDGGATWSDITTGINTADYALFYVPMAMDSSTPTTLYLGTYRLYKTTNKGANWFLPSPGLSLTGGDVISAIAVAPPNGQYVYVGTANGHFYFSMDGGSNFVERDVGLPIRFVTKIAVDYINPQKVYVALSGFGGYHIFVTASAGSTWSDISSNLPDTPANSVAVDAAGWVYLGTDIGVFVSTNGGTSWAVFGTGLPTVTVFDLVFTAGGELLAATHGRGVWSIGTNFVPRQTGFDFSLSTSGGSSNLGGITVVRGNSGAITITANLVVGTPQSVGLACATPLPTGVSCSFGPSSGSPTFTSTLTVTVALSTTPGFYTIKVTGTGGGLTRSTLFIVLVT